MRKRILALFLLATLAFSSANAIEIGAFGTTTNLWYLWTGVATAPAVTAWPTTNWFWGADVWLSAPLGEDSSVRIEYQLDPVLRNVLSAKVHFEKGVTRIDVGPTFGFLNSSSAPFSAGLSAAVELRWPGVAYASVRSDGGLAIGLVQLAQPQAYSELAAGFYVPNAIVSGVISGKRFSDVDAAGLSVIDTLTRYAMTIDIFKKNIPYTLFASAGYEIHSKWWQGSGKTDTLGALVLGIKADAIFVPGLRFMAGIDSDFYVFGLDNLSGKGPLTDSFLLNANLGFALDLDTFKIETAPVPEPASVPETKAAEPADATGEAKDGAPAGSAGSAVAASDKGAGPTDAGAASAQSVPAEAKPADATTSTAEAAPEKKPGPGIGIDVGTGLFYDAYPPPIPGFALSALLNARVGVWGDIRFNIFPFISLGAEAGAAYFTYTATVLATSVTLSYLDIPIRAKLGFDVGLVQLEGFGGVMVSANTVTGLSPVLALGIDAGARARLLGFYAEADYVFSLTATLPSTLRFGAGYAFKFN